MEEPLKFQTPCGSVVYGTDGMYSSSLTVAVPRSFAEFWRSMEGAVLSAAAPNLAEKFGEDFDIGEYWRSAITTVYWDTEGLKLSLPVYDGKCSTEIFDENNETKPHNTIAARDRIVVLLEVLGLWLKNERSGVKVKVVQIKDYGEEAQVEFISDSDEPE